MDNFPIAKSYLNKSFRTNKKLQVLMPQFEKALDENQKVRQEILAIRPEISKSLFNASLYDTAATVTKSERDLATKTMKFVETCYGKITHLEQLMQQAELGNILNYAVKCKEDETLREIASLKESFQEEAKQLDLLERRSSVQHLRQLQSNLEKERKELALLKREADNLEQQRANKMKRATDLRNKKIINILQTRKLIFELERKLKGAPVESQTQDDAMAFDSQLRKQIPSVPPKGPILQPALDFLSQFMHSKSFEKKKENEPEEEKGLHSILHRRSAAPSPAKQVRFVASPDMESVHIVERVSSMSDDDGSGECPGYSAEKEKGSQEEVFGEEEYEGTEEEEEYEDNTEENEDEMKLESTGNEEADMVESSGDEESENKGKKQPIESEKDEESDASWVEAEEQMDVEGNPRDSVKVGKQKKKVEVLSVVVIPPPPKSKGQKPDTVQKPSTSRYSRFKKSSSDAMDVDEEEAPLQQNMEDEDDNEIPMAQPKPKQPPPVESPPSSELGESMLNFSAPNCAFNEDFWLNASNSANNNTDQFYDL